MPEDYLERAMRALSEDLPDEAIVYCLLDIANNLRWIAAGETPPKRGS